MGNKNIYVEFIGFSCIGKTYLRNKIYEVIEADNRFSIYKRTNKLTALFKSLKNLKYFDLKLMFEFFSFIRKNREYSFSQALNRTIAILLRPLQYRENIKNSIIIVDDGPIGKLSTNGIYDKSWLKLLELSRPSITKYETVYIFLTLDEDEHKRRLQLRGQKTNFLDNNVNEMLNPQKASKNKRIESYAFWENELKNLSSNCLRYKLEDYNVDKLAKEIYEKITKKTKDES